MGSTDTHTTAVMPQHTFERIGKEIDQIGKAAPTSATVRREEDVQGQRVDTWQGAGKSHTVETYKKNADGTLSKTYVKAYPNGLREESRLEVGPKGTMKESIYTNGNKRTRVCIETLSDGSRNVLKEDSNGKRSLTHLDPSGKPVEMQGNDARQGSSAPSGLPDEAPPCSTTPAEGATPRTSGAAPSTVRPEPQRLERDRKAYLDFFKQLPSHGDKKWYDQATQKLAENGNTYAAQRLERARREQQQIERAGLDALPPQSAVPDFPYDNPLFA